MERQPSCSPPEIYRVTIECRLSHNKPGVLAQDRCIIKKGCGVPHYPQETCCRLVISPNTLRKVSSEAAPNEGSGIVGISRNKGILSSFQG